MSNGSSTSELEVMVVMVGAITIAVWAWRAVYRKMIANQKGAPLASLSAGLGVIILSICWISLVVIAFAPAHWLRLSPVVLVALAVFYAAWRYTRVLPAIESGAVAGTDTPVMEPEPVVTPPVAQYSVARDSFPTPKAARPARPVTTKMDADILEAAVLPALYEFDYAKEDGEISSRRVFVQSTSVSGGRQYLEGICKTRNAKRTFRVDRVIGPMIRVEDGYVIRAPELFDMSFPKPFSDFSTSTPLSTPKPRTVRERKIAVVFAGFGSAKRSELEELAEAAGWQIRSSITKTVTYVVQGSMAGNVQLSKANELEIPVLDEDMFRRRV